MTMPTLIGRYKKQEATARLKKFYSTMSQAVLMAENDNGTRAYQWIDVDDYKDQINENPQIDFDLTYSYWQKYFAPYIKSLNVEKGVYVLPEEDGTNNSTSTKVYFSDGSTMSMHIGHCIDLNFDVNGAKKPNEVGKDVFVFFIATNKSYNKVTESEIHRNKSFAAVYLPEYDTREKALAACKTTPSRCSALLQYDNWEFKDDYPYKL